MTRRLHINRVGVFDLADWLSGVILSEPHRNHHIEQDSLNNGMEIYELG